MVHVMYLTISGVYKVPSRSRINEGRKLLTMTQVFISDRATFKLSGIVIWLFYCTFKHRECRERMLTLRTDALRRAPVTL